MCYENQAEAESRRSPYYDNGPGAYVIFQMSRPRSRGWPTFTR
jgi:hypothetical protein